MTLSSRTLAEVYETILTNLNAEEIVVGKMHKYKVESYNDVMTAYNHISTATPLDLDPDVEWLSNNNAVIIVNKTTINQSPLGLKRETSLVWSREFIVEGIE